MRSRVALFNINLLHYNTVGIFLQGVRIVQASVHNLYLFLILPLQDQAPISNQGKSARTGSHNFLYSLGRNYHKFHALYFPSSP